jgi:hypothetical protein
VAAAGRTDPLAARLLFNADLIRTYTRRDGPASQTTWYPLEQDLRAAASHALCSRIPRRTLEGLDSRLLRFHASIGALQGATTSKHWLGYSNPGRLLQGVACPLCNYPADMQERYSGLYKGYARRLVYCSRHGLVTDQPAAWDWIRPRLEFRLEKSGHVIRLKYPADGSPGPIRVGAAFERFGAPGKVSRIRLLGTGGPPVHIALRLNRKLVPGVYWLRTVHVSDGDYAYERYFLENSLSSSSIPC